MLNFTLLYNYFGCRSNAQKTAWMDPFRLSSKQFTKHTQYSDVNYIPDPMRCVYNRHMSRITPKSAQWAQIIALCSMRCVVMVPAALLVYIPLQCRVSMCAYVGELLSNGELPQNSPDILEATNLKPLRIQQKRKGKVTKFHLEI